MSSSHVAQLETLLQQPGSLSRSDSKSALQRVHAELKERTRHSTPSSVAYTLDVLRTLSRFKGAVHAAARLSCLFDSCLFLYTQGENYHALNAISQLAELARHTRDKAWTRRAHNLSGVINADLGNVADAVIHYSKALSLAREIQNVPGEVSVLNNLGIALNYGGLHRDAIPCLVKAIEIMQLAETWRAFDSDDVPITAKEQECALLTNLAQTCLYVGEFARGFEAISSCLAKSDMPRDAFRAHNMVIREFTCVRLALALGKLSIAEEHSKACRGHALLAAGPAHTMALVAAGLCEINGSNPDRGIASLKKALNMAPSAAIRIDVMQALANAYDLLGKPADALEHVRQLLTTMQDQRSRGILTILEMPLCAAPAEFPHHDVDGLNVLKQREAQLRAAVAEKAAIDSRIEMLERFAVAADVKEEASGEHGYRVGALASLLAKDIGCSRNECFAIELAARLHDIGKIGVPDRILLNSQELKEAERHFMATHTILGAELLAKSNIPQLRMAEQIARSHHEWWNGEGYPSKLKGKRIPLHARIVALADVFDALTHGRPYAEAWPIDQALAEIRNRRGTQFDPDLTDLFVELIERLRKQHADLDGYLGRASRDSPFLQARNKIRVMLASERENERSAAVEGNETRH